MSPCFGLRVINVLPLFFLVETEAAMFAKYYQAEEIVPMYWRPEQQFDLTYCISTEPGLGFHDDCGGDQGDCYELVRQSLEEAAATWEAIVNVDFRHASALDGTCSTASPSEVRFRVVPTQTGQTGSSAVGRVVQAECALNGGLCGASGPGVVTLGYSNWEADATFARPTTFAQVVVHEFGHALGLVHEGLAVGAAVAGCASADATLTPEWWWVYDGGDWFVSGEVWQTTTGWEDAVDYASVMMYPTCGEYVAQNGGPVNLQDRIFTLSDRDIAAVRAWYGEPMPDMGRFDTTLAGWTASAAGRLGISCRRRGAHGREARIVLRDGSVLSVRSNTNTGREQGGGGALLLVKVRAPTRGGYWRQLLLKRLLWLDEDGRLVRETVAVDRLTDAQRREVRRSYPLAASEALSVYGCGGTRRGKGEKPRTVRTEGQP